MAVFDVVACPATPITHLAVVLAPCMDSSVTNGDLGLTTSFAFEVGGLVYVMVDTAADTSYSVSGGETVRTPIYGQAFVLKGLFQGPDTLGDLASFGVVSPEILNFTL